LSITEQRAVGFIPAWSLAFLHKPFSMQLGTVTTPFYLLVTVKFPFAPFNTVELIPNIILRDCKIYPLNMREQEELDKFLDEHLKSGRIRPSKSPCAALFFFINRSLCPVQDYQQLNKVIIKNKYPLLSI